MPEKTPIDISESGPINDLFLAINHYMATGDHIGEGHAIPVSPTHIAFALPYSPRELEDRENWERLLARLTQINDEENLPIEVVSYGRQAGFEMMGMTIAVADMQRLTGLLKAKPGPLGWGGVRQFLIDHGIIPPD